MKAKTIKAVLAKKCEELLASVEDEALRKEMKRTMIVTGGSIASMLLREKVTDYDIYFSELGVVKRVAEYYVERFNAQRAREYWDRKAAAGEEVPEDRSKIPDGMQGRGIPVPIWVEQLEDIRGAQRVRCVVKSAGIEAEGRDSEYDYFEGREPEAAQGYVNEVYDGGDGDTDALGDIEDTYEGTKSAVREGSEADQPDQRPPYRPVFISSNAITLANKVQIVLRFYGEPDEIHANYDFQHCTNYYRHHNSEGRSELVLRKEALQRLLERQLVYQGSRYPVCSLFRVRKFVARGWTINAGQMLKIILQVSELNLNDFKVLEDQLTGVDVAYFCQMLESAKSKAGNDGEQPIDSAYLVEIIDRMFGD